ncbi:MAG TPA: hypothetical protein ENG11_00510 [candidate division Zixibacteria bacterium]|nr:hypothetical protein [candidate division Zixibacteria bacterium]
MRAKFLIVCAVALMMGELFAAGEPAKFLWMGIGARGLAMGNTGTAYINTPWAPFYNPASVSARGKFSAAASNQFLALDRKIYAATISAEIYEEAGVGLTWIHSGVSGVESRNEDGQKTGTVANGNDAIFFAFGKNLAGKFHIGLGVEYIESSIENVTVTTAGFGGGVSYRIQKPDITIGFVAQNLFMKFLWNSNNYYGTGQTVEEKVPELVRGGVSYSFRVGGAECNLSADIRDYPSAGKFEYGVGAEVNPIPQISIRGGFNGEHPTFGVGVRTKLGKLSNIGVDYALVPENRGVAPRHIVDLMVEY